MRDVLCCHGATVLPAAAAARPMGHGGTVTVATERVLEFPSQWVLGVEWMILQGQMEISPIA